MSFDLNKVELMDYVMMTKCGTVVSILLAESNRSTVAAVIFTIRRNQ